MKYLERFLIVSSVSTLLALLHFGMVGAFTVDRNHGLETSMGKSQESHLAPKDLHSTLLIRHIRSVNPQQQQLNDLEADDNIQSNAVSEEESETSHKMQKPFVSSDMFPLQNYQIQATREGPVLHKWLFRGTGQPPFARGLRRDSHFIRFGRNANLNLDGFNLGTSNNGNKKNNFIRLGRENPRRNNFIRLGRSGGLWGNNERFGSSKVGYFPDYYSQGFGGNPNILDFAETQHQPLPYDSDIVMQG